MSGFWKTSFELVMAGVNVNSLFKYLKIFFRVQNRIAIYIYALIKSQSSKIKGDLMVNYAKEFKDAIESKNWMGAKTAMSEWQKDPNAENESIYWLAFSMVCSLSDLNDNATKAIYKANSLPSDNSDIYNWYYRQANDLKTFSRKHQFNNPFMKDLVMKEVEL